MPCANPTAEPVDPVEDIEVSHDRHALPKALPEDDHNDSGLLKELEMLRGLEEELAYINAVEEEKEKLDALEKEILMMDVDQVLDEVPKETKTTSPVHETIESKLVEMGFSRSIAFWAADTSHGWSAALDKAYIRTQEEEYMELLQAEKEEEARKKKEEEEARKKKEEEEARKKKEEEEEEARKKEEEARKKEASKRSKSARPPATPCSSPGQPPKPTQMLPPVVSSKKPDVPETCS